MNILAMILAIITLICIWRGYVRGLFRSILVAGAVVLAMVISSYACPYVSKALQEYTGFDEQIETYIVKQLNLDLKKEESNKNQQMQIIDGLACPEALKLAIINNNNSEVYEGFQVDGFAEYLAHYLSCVAMNCLAFVIVQVLFMVGMLIIIYMTKLLTDIPILHGIDKTGGIILGLIQALAIIWSIFIFISLIGSTPLGMNAFVWIQENPVLDFLYENNWLMDTITNVSNVIFS